NVSPPNWATTSGNAHGNCRVARPSKIVTTSRSSVRRRVIPQYARSTSMWRERFGETPPHVITLDNPPADVARSCPGTCPRSASRDMTIPNRPPFGGPVVPPIRPPIAPPIRPRPPNPPSASGTDAGISLATNFIVLIDEQPISCARAATLELAADVAQ